VSERVVELVAIVRWNELAETAHYPGLDIFHVRPAESGTPVGA